VMNVLFESPGAGDRVRIDRWIRAGASVWIVEPFHAAHHATGIRFFPPPLPSFIERYVREKFVRVVNCSDIRAREIYQLAADEAVEVAGPVFEVYRRRHAPLIDYTCRVVGSETAENGFLKVLAERIAEFYSINLLLSRARDVIGPGRVLAYLKGGSWRYRAMRSLLEESGSRVYDCAGVRFPRGGRWRGAVSRVSGVLVCGAYLVFMWACACLVEAFRLGRRIERGRFATGAMLVGPRQLADNRRGPGFFLEDGVGDSGFVCFSTVALTAAERTRLAEQPGALRALPPASRFFSNPRVWAGLLIRVLGSAARTTATEIKTAWSLLQGYLIWSRCLERVRFERLVTHCDFGVDQVGRNIALRQAGVVTWYFSDSANGGWNWQTADGGRTARHPFWCGLDYDHLVTWSEEMADYHAKHPASFRNAHVVGCLWSSHIVERAAARRESGLLDDSEADDAFVIACFDSTYTTNGVTSYEEGIAFAEDIRRLVADVPGVIVLFKEKKARGAHLRLDREMGPRLLQLYEEMASDGSRIRFYADDADSSKLISVSDIVVSFPFTSTTFEALSASRPAIWHDACCLYGDSPNGRVAGAVTFGYDDLLRTVEALKGDPGVWRNPYPSGSPLLDPYRDGEALDRFRRLLVQS